jgi:hypothetical protein
MTICPAIWIHTDLVDEYVTNGKRVLKDQYDGWKISSRFFYSHILTLILDAFCYIETYAPHQNICCLAFRSNANLTRPEITIHLKSIVYGESSKAQALF